MLSHGMHLQLTKFKHVIILSAVFVLIRFRAKEPTPVDDLAWLGVCQCHIE